MHSPHAQPTRRQQQPAAGSDGCCRASEQAGGQQAGRGLKKAGNAPLGRRRRPCPAAWGQQDQGGRHQLRLESSLPALALHPASRNTSGSLAVQGRPASLAPPRRPGHPAHIGLDGLAVGAHRARRLVGADHLPSCREVDGASGESGVVTARRQHASAAAATCCCTARQPSHPLPAPSSWRAAAAPPAQTAGGRAAGWGRSAERRQRWQQEQRQPWQVRMRLEQCKDRVHCGGPRPPLGEGPPPRVLKSAWRAVAALPWLNAALSDTAAGYGAI